MMQRFAIADLPVTPWKNGGGITREVACWPPGAGLDDFDWRVSIASIAAGGPFSRFAGVDRIITLLEGDGVRLQGDRVDHRLDTELRPFPFSGDLEIECTLLGGVSCDFNVMSRRGRVRAELNVLRGAADLAVSRHGLLLAWRGRWQAETLHVDPGQGLWWGAESAAWCLTSVDADAVLLAVRWH